MEILEKGKDVSRVSRCETCGAVIKYQPGDVEVGKNKISNVPPEFLRENGGTYDYCRIEYYEFIKCPCCKCEIVL